MDMNAYTCPNLGQTMLVKGAPVVAQTVCQYLKIPAC